ncbi:uncharacterized protein LOC133874065 isoform X2 [Alnus glutinosa]|uniref:uncharacterized protein LOC133874065 isoform X2 n=1 Tax=Alnus glutinosa TaxID=3517 RepID=UPI002D7A2FEB|nr:uncharacterized protein LOC133874065 isoform X2 [Alnus glutinosa]
MRNRSRAKKPETFGKGKVTPIQVAFIVDRYLLDNKYSETRSVFRTEASSLISNSPVREAPKSLLSLGAMLNEYICLKEQKVMVDQERVRLEQEKCRVQTLLQGMQAVMNTYNSSGAFPSQLNISNGATRSAIVAVPQPVLRNSSPSGCPVSNTTVNPVSTPANTIMKPGSLSSPITDPSVKKRKDDKVSLDAPQAAKRSRSKVPARNIPKKDNAVECQEIAQPSCAIRSSPDNCLPDEPLVQGSSVAKCLFNRPLLSIPSNSSDPKTPVRPNSSPSDKSTSPLEISSSATCSNRNTSQVITPTRCTVISSKRVTVSPNSQILYSMERSHCISASSPIKTNLKRQSKRDHVKGRLDFDVSDVATNSDKPTVGEISTSESGKEVDIFDIDFPNLDALGDFSFSEMLGDLDLDLEGVDYSCHPTLGSSFNISGSSSLESVDVNVEANQLMSEYSSTMTEVLSEKGMNINGSDSLTAVKSITKCITILSPAKSRRSSLHGDYYSEETNCLKE